MSQKKAASASARGRKKQRAGANLKRKPSGGGAEGREGSVLIYATVPADPAKGGAFKTGEKIIQELLKKRLIACGNLLPGARSFFRWEGKTQTASESLLIMKTSARCFPAAMEKIKELHPYECPCILSLPCADGFPPFLKWIEDSCP